MLRTSSLFAAALILSGCLATIPYETRTNQYNSAARSVQTAEVALSASFRLNSFIAKCRQNFESDVNSGVPEAVARDELGRCLSVAEQLKGVPGTKPARVAATQPRPTRRVSTPTPPPSNAGGGTLLDAILAPPNLGTCRYDNGDSC